MARMIFSMILIGFLGLSIGLSLGCSTQSKDLAPKESAASAKSDSGGPSQAPVSDVQILEDTTLRSLDSVASALRLIIEKQDSDEIASGDLIHNCEVSREEAARWLPRLDRLIAEKTRIEIERYVENPSSYESTRGFESCGQDCVCGAFAKVLEKVTSRAFSNAVQKTQHRRNQVRLEAKSSRIQSFERVNCARKQGWFCGSQLRDFLIQESQRSGASMLD